MRGVPGKLAVAAAALAAALLAGSVASTAQEAGGQAISVEVTEDRPFQGERILCDASGVVSGEVYLVEFKSKGWVWSDQEITAGSPGHPDGIIKAAFTVPRQSQVDDPAAPPIAFETFVCTYYNQLDEELGSASFVPGPEVTVSNPTPAQGETITCTASGLVPGETYEILFTSATWLWDSQSVTADADRVATVEFKIPRESNESAGSLIPEWGVVCGFADSSGTVGRALMDVQDAPTSDGTAPSAGDGKTTAPGFTG